MLALVMSAQQLRSPKGYISEVQRIMPNILSMLVCFSSSCLILLHAGPRIKGEHEFETYIEFANRVKMDDT
jgi:hypothetical protein